MGRAGQPGSSRIQHYEYRIDGEGEWISTESTDRTHTIAGLIAGRVYFFHLRAVSAAGASAHRISPKATPVADLDFTHFANGGFITSTLALVNAGAYPVRPAIYFYDRDGDPIEARRVVDLTPDLEVADDGALRPRAVMNPLEELTISTHGRGGLRAGSVTVRAPVPSAGSCASTSPATGPRSRGQPDPPGCPAPGAPPGDGHQHGRRGPQPGNLHSDPAMPIDAGRRRARRGGYPA